MTLTIVARDADTGSLGIAITTNPISVSSRCPFIKSNVGAVSTQAYSDPGLGPLAINLLAMGFSPDKILKELKESDEHFEYRQIGIVDKNGRAAVYTGIKCKDSSGAIAGDGYVVMGNCLLNDMVVPAMNDAWLGTKGQLFEDRLLAVVTAGRDKGGDSGGHRSAGILVHESQAYPRTDLRIDFVPKRVGGPDAIDALRELLERWRPLIPYYKERPHHPMLAGWLDWLDEHGHSFRD